MDLPLVELVKLGFLGFSVAIMLLAFLTLRNLIAQRGIPAAKLAVMAREIRIYMGVSLTVVILGILWEFVNPKVEVVIDVSPQDIAGYDVRIGGESVKLPKEKIVSLKNGSQIVLELIKFERQIANLRTQIQGLTEQAKAVQQAQLNRATTAGERKKESGI